MCTSKTRIHELKNVEIRMIAGCSGHFSDLFLSKQKTPNQRGHLPTSKAKLKILKKNLLRLSNFFDPPNIFDIKSAIKVGLFLDKNGNLILIVTLLENVFHEYLKNGTFI